MGLFRPLAQKFRRGGSLVPQDTCIIKDHAFAGIARVSSAYCCLINITLTLAYMARIDSLVVVFTSHLSSH
jgi:hypothetical protein